MIDWVVSSLCAVGGLLLAYVVFEYAYRLSYGDLNKLPGPTPLPFIGSTYYFPRDRTKIDAFLTITSERFRSKYGAFLIWIGFLPSVSVSSPDVVQKVLSTSKHTSKGFFYKQLYPWLGRGLLTSDGEEWHARRHLLTPTFHFSILNEFGEIMNAQAAILVQQLANHADTGKTIDAFKFITLCALDIIMETAMGVSLGSQLSGEENAYVAAVYSMTSQLILRGRKPWLLNDFLFSLSSEYREERETLKVLHGFTEKAIKDRRQSIDLDDAKGKRHLTFLDMLLTAKLPDGSALSDVQIREEVDTFMFEGHDTTSAAAAWGLYLIGSHPDVQKKVHEELDDVLGAGDDITTENANKLKYLDMVLKEALRLKPSVPAIMRELSEPIQLEDVTLPKGLGVLVRIWAMHRDPKLWDEPMKFDPDRWSTERSKNYHTYQYIPFSAGPRNCIGQKFAQLEDKVLIGKVLKNFRIETDQSVTVHAIPDLILRPSPQMPVKIFKR